MLSLCLHAVLRMLRSLHPTHAHHPTQHLADAHRPATAEMPSPPRTPHTPHLQKCATTSLFHHLKAHPQVLCPEEKEPEFFTDDCGHQPTACPAEMQSRYVLEVRVRCGGRGVHVWQSACVFGGGGRGCSTSRITAASPRLPPPLPASLLPPAPVAARQTLHLQRALRHNLYRATEEGSTHYAREGLRIAQGVREVGPAAAAAALPLLLPWLLYAGCPLQLPCRCCLHGAVTLHSAGG